MKGRDCFDAVLQELLQATKSAASHQDVVDALRLAASDLNRSNASLTDRVRGLDERLKEEIERTEGIHQLLVDLRPHVPSTIDVALYQRFEKMISDTDEIPF
jgi:predicted  nucleic acid-binding Zn-ribbon protein